jgi:aminoglycoside phosphotransferase
MERLIGRLWGLAWVAPFPWAYGLPSAGEKRMRLYRMLDELF